MDEQILMRGGPVFVLVLTTLIVLLVLVSTVVTAMISCKICAKAGYSWALGLLTLVPVVGAILPFYLAFTDWPIQRELRQLKEQSGRRFA